jgi:acyl-homoserine lactone acylase PvdQ
VILRGASVRRTGPVAVLAICGVALSALAAQPAFADNGSNQCVTKQGPVGNPFVDCSGGQIFNIVPPGQTGTYNREDFLGAHLPPPAGPKFPAHTRDQEGMYANLIKAAPNLTAADISPTYYKDASFLADLAKAERVEKFTGTHEGTVILRDKEFGVPHIFGKTRADTEFGSGFASAEDRLFEMDTLRHVGRAQLTSFIGPSESNERMDCSVASAAGYSEKELEQQVANFPKQHPDPITIEGRRTTDGQQIVSDATAFVEGVNEYATEMVQPGGGANKVKMPVEYEALQIPFPAPHSPTEWKGTDIVATATLVQAIFATGGGNETGSALLYRSLVNRYGQEKGAKIWNDLRSQNDPGAQVSIKTPFNYEQVPSSVNPNSLAMPTKPHSDAYALGHENCQTSLLGSLPAQFSVAGVTVDLSPLLDALSAGKPHASNELIVDGAHSATGHPIAVFGPQTGYFVPQLLHEIDLHGPGLQARGVSFAGTEVFVELGHGVDYAWSATSAGADIVDQRLEKLCNTDRTAATMSSMAYIYNGVCTPMYEREDKELGKPSLGAPNGAVLLTIKIERTVHGPVIGRTMAKDPTTGQEIPVAVSSQRSTFGDELGAAPAFMEWNDPEVIHNATDFQRAAGKETGTFNWTYVDSKNVAYYMAGKIPVRNPEVNPNFPTWGTGKWDWQGFVPSDLSAADLHPRASTIPAGNGVVNGAFSNGFFTNWNNKPAPGFSAADNQFAYGPVYRVQSLSDRVQAILSKRPATPADVVNAMEDAGSVDLDGAQLVGPIAAVLSGATLTTAEQQALGILQNWAQDSFWGAGVTGAHRRDRSGSGSYEQGNAVAIMDKLYPRLASAILGPWLSPRPGASDGDSFAQLAGLNPPVDTPRAQGSAYDGGWDGYLQRSLLQAANPSIANGYSQVYCGGDSSGAGGSLASCQQAVKGALDSTIEKLTSIYGSSYPATWTCSRSNETGQQPGSGQGDGSKCNPALDDIQYNEVGVGSVPSMPWVNRPTFQQVVQFPAGRSSDSSGESCHEGDGNGQFGDSQSGQGNFSFDADPCDDGAPEGVSAQDSRYGTDFHSTQTQSVTYDDAAHSVTIAGLGTDKGVPVTFVMTAVDSELVPGGLFSLVLSDGYSHSGPLSSGAVKLH